jgi:Flp pilus assembly protein TadD
LDGSGANYIWLGQFDKALPENLIALEKEPTNIAGQVNLGMTYLSLNRFDDAETVADKLRSLAPGNPYYFLSNVRLKVEENQLVSIIG